MTTAEQAFEVWNALFNRITADDTKWVSGLLAQMPAQSLSGTPQSGKSVLSLELLRAVTADQKSERCLRGMRPRTILLPLAQ
jgi:hypothetical protein